MANPKIKVKRSSVEGKVPAVTQLERGELAVNSYDGKVYILKDQFSVGIATTTHTINPWNEPSGVGAGISYSGDILVTGIATFFKSVRAHNGIIIGDDNKSILLGTSDDMRIRHTGSHSEITDEGTGDLRLGSSRTVIGNPTFSETCARFVQNGPSELYHDNTLRLKTSSSGVNITDDLGVSGITTANVLNFGDSNGSTTNIAKFGSGGDFTIQHNPSFFGGGQVFNALTSFNGNLQIENRDTSGSNRFLFLKSNVVQLRTYTGNESLLTATINAGVSLFYDNSEKFVTTNTGGTLTGTLVTDGLTVGNYDFPTVAGSEGLVLKVASDGNLEFGSGAAGGVVPTEKTFTASQGQTVFTDTTDLPTYVQVFVNGIKIRPTSDFSKSGASITLVSAATAGDEIDLVRFD